MPYGQLDRKQTKALKAVVKGKRIHDLGCGDQLLSGDLVKFGALEVVAIDTHPHGDPGRRIKTLPLSFADYAAISPDIEVAFVSWPVNHEDEGLLSLVSMAKTVVYLGKCTDGACCGWPGLFEHFLGRELLAHVPDEYNSLFVYGGKLAVKRTGENEELAGLDWVKIRPYYRERRGLDAGT